MTLWAAFMLARTPDTCGSILRGDPVQARQLDPVALRRALRGAELPNPGDYITVTAVMLEAIDESGPFLPRAL